MGRVFDMVSTRAKDAGFFLSQHLNSNQHRRLLAQRRGQPNEPGLEPGPPAKVPCQGLCLEDDSARSLQHMSDHMKCWLGWHSASDLQKHHYSFVSAKGVYELRHQLCLKECDPNPVGRNVCERCYSLGKRDSLLRNVVRSAVKKLAAEHLRMRLFQAEEVQKEHIAKLKQSILYQRSRSQIDRVLNFKDYELQSWVRKSFLTIRPDQRTVDLEAFMNNIVKPCVQVNVNVAAKQKPDLVNVQGHFERFLLSQQGTEMDALCIKIAQSSLNGQLANHPMLMGMLVSCIRVLDREANGKSSRGRTGNKDVLVSDTAVNLASQAGTMLALATGSNFLMKKFGFPRVGRNFGDIFSQLESSSLPVPFLSLSSPAHIRNNLELVDQRLSAVNDSCGCA